MASRVLSAGHRVTAVAGRTSLGRLPAELLVHPNLTVLRGDLSSDFRLPSNIDAIVHAAARSPGPDVAISDLIRDNVLATLRLAAHARHAGARKFIYLSSLSVFGRITGGTVDETTPVLDPCPYGTTKLIGEQLLADQADAFATLAMRLPGIIGPGSIRNWLSTVLEKAKRGEPIPFYNPEAAFNNAVHIEDLVALILRLLDNDWQGFDMVTLGAAGRMKVQDVVAAIVAETGGRSLLRLVDAPQEAFTIASRRAVENYGYHPLAIKDMVLRFVRENCHLAENQRDI